MKDRKKPYLLLFSALLSCIYLLCGCSEKEESNITSVEQLNESGHIVGVGIGTSSAHDVEEAFPNAEIQTFTEASEGFMAVQRGIIDGYAASQSVIENALASGSLENVKMLDENVGEETRIVAGISRKSNIPMLQKKINEFLAEKKADGTMDDIYRRWVLEADENMPEIPVPENPTCQLVVGTTGLTAPFSFYKDRELTGMDIELIYRLADYLNAELVINTYDFFGIITAMETGDCDCVFSNLNATPEREESMDFSDPVYTTYTRVLVYDENAAEHTTYTSVAQLNNPNVKLGIVTGTTFEETYATATPQAEVKYYNTFSDMFYALSIGQIDGYVEDAPLARYRSSQMEGLVCLEEELPPYYDFAFAFGKTEMGRKITEDFNDFIAGLKEDGTIDEMFDLWEGSDEEAKVVDFPTEGPNGVIKIATSSETPPIVYIKDGEIAGLEMDILARFCREYGFGAEINDINFQGILQGVSSGRYDIAAGYIAITEERAESVSFSEPYANSSNLMVVAKAVKKGNFLDNLSASFEKTFIREDRWKLIAEGIETTVIISVASALFGTILGFGICMLRRMKNPLVHGITTVYIRILQGTPLVVLLMIMFYIVFAKSGVSGEWVAIIAFALNFAAYVSEIIRSGIDSIDIGQTEAALAIGYTKPQAFFRIVMPQAARQFMPVYKGEFISLVKMTSIVGYITVQDLTKMSDIIRSRTYEAFFPLIATAIIYFIISALLTMLLKAVEVKIEPDRENRTVKGVTMK